MVTSLSIHPEGFIMLIVQIIGGLFWAAVGVWAFIMLKRSGLHL